MSGRTDRPAADPIVGSTVFWSATVTTIVTHRSTVTIDAAAGRDEVESEMSDYYWCLTHGQVEVGTTCRATDRLGPYDTREAALTWRDRVDRRNDEWQAEDERWAAEWDDDDQDAGGA